MKENPASLPPIQDELQTSVVIWSDNLCTDSMRSALQSLRAKIEAIEEIPGEGESSTYHLIYKVDSEALAARSIVALGNFGTIIEASISRS